MLHPGWPENQCVISGTDKRYCLQHVQPDSRANVVSSPMGTESELKG